MVQTVRPYAIRGFPREFDTFLNYFVADSFEPFKVKSKIVVLKEYGFNSEFVYDVFYVLYHVICRERPEGLAHVQVNGAETAVKRAAPAGYHGYCSILETAVFYVHRIKILFHVNQMIRRIW